MQFVIALVCLAAVCLPSISGWGEEPGRSNGYPSFPRPQQPPIQRLPPVFRQPIGPGHPLYDPAPPSDPWWNNPGRVGPNRRPVIGPLVRVARPNRRPNRRPIAHRRPNRRPITGPLVRVARPHRRPNRRPNIRYHRRPNNKQWGSNEW